MEEEQRALKVEEAKTRGTPVTLESFAFWKAKFDRELQQRRQKDEDERLKGLTAKEKEEFKRIASRLTGIYLRLHSRRSFIGLQ